MQMLSGINVWKVWLKDSIQLAFKVIILRELVDLKTRVMIYYSYFHSMLGYFMKSNFGVHLPV